MATSFSAIGQLPNAYQQQPTVPVSNDQTRLTRQQNQKPTEEAIQPRQAEAGQAQNSGSLQTQGFLDQVTAFLGEDGSTSSVPRGSVVDVVV